MSRKRLERFVVSVREVVLVDLVVGGANEQEVSEWTETSDFFDAVSEQIHRQVVLERDCDVLISDSPNNELGFDYVLRRNEEGELEHEREDIIA
jgi:hypothetical protein